MVDGLKGSKNYHNGEDPAYVLEHGLSIDVKYYIEKQLRKPLTRILEPIMGNVNRLFTGAHTYKIKQWNRSKGVFGITKFVTKQKSCLGCKTKLGESRKVHATCQHCSADEPSLYLAHLDSVRDLEDVHARAWSHCQRCSGTLHQPVICTNTDCPIYYRRKMVQMDLEEAQGKLQRFIH